MYKYLKEIGEVEQVTAIVIRPVSPESLKDEFNSDLLNYRPLIMTEEVMMAAGQCANEEWVKQTIKQNHKI
ncbi:MAG: hypothetical protein ACK4M9_22660 [Anaerobacillus sp.]|uniref:hypothetical protein n=1 Tax=Anaerobacillus sp. TaxID=1872506 RepID=UPI00391B3CAB